MALLAMRFLEGKTTDYGDALGEIQIGDFDERFHMSLSHWSPSEYAAHWRSSIAQLVGGRSRGCLLTSIEGPTSPHGRVFWWVYYRDGDDVVFQNHVLMLSDVDGPFVPEEAERWIPHRETETEEGQPISEWRTPFHGLETEVVG